MKLNPITKEKCNKLIDDLRKRFYENTDCTLEFTATKSNEIYQMLQNDIMKITKIQISTSTLRNIVTGIHKCNFQNSIYLALLKYTSPQTFKPRSEKYEGLQRIFWGVNQGLAPGAFIEKLDGPFIEWETLQKELNERGIVQCPKKIPVGSKVIKSEFYGKADWVLQIVDKNMKVVGSVWIGGNPYDGWSQDGLVRIGKTISDTKWEVFQILGRFEDGSYRLLKSFV